MLFTLLCKIYNSRLRVCLEIKKILHFGKYPVQIIVNDSDGVQTRVPEIRLPGISRKMGCWTWTILFFIFWQIFCQMFQSSAAPSVCSIMINHQIWQKWRKALFLNLTLTHFSMVLRVPTRNPGFCYPFRH